MKNPKYLSPIDDYNEFFKYVKVGDLIEYSIAFMLDDVIKIAKRFGLVVEYKGPATQEYNRYGSFIVKVVGSTEKIQESEPVLFDINMLNTPTWK